MLNNKKKKKMDILNHTIKYNIYKPAKNDKEKAFS